MVEGGSCFIAVPASQGSLRETIGNALQSSGIQMVGGEDFNGTSLPVRAIQRADLVIADITLLGPYAFYTLGVADALHKPVLVIGQRPVNFFGDFAGHKLVTYGPEEFEKLAGYIQYWVRDTLESGAQRPYTAAVRK